MIYENAYGKLNICLSVGARTENGYHLLDSLMQTVSLCDLVSLEKADTVSLEVKGQRLSCGEDNLAVKAARLFFRESGVKGGASICIEKHIPQWAGLGGGSADGAAVLRGLNRLYGSPFTAEQLEKISLELGADVPFCLAGGTKRARGIGEKLSAIKERKLYLVLLYGKERLSTPEMYRALDNGDNPYPDAEAFFKSWEADPDYCLCGNSFLPFAAERDGTVNEHIALLKTQGALYSGISGKGPTVFGIFADGEKAAAAAKAVGGIYAESVNKI